MIRLKFSKYISDDRVFHVNSFKLYMTRIICKASITPIVINDMEEFANICDHASTYIGFISTIS